MTPPPHDGTLPGGAGQVHVILLNQVREPQKVRVTFDEKVLGRSLTDAALTVHLDNQPAPSIHVKDAVAELTLPPLGIATLTLDGVHLDIPTHRIAPPATTPLPTEPAQQVVSFPNSQLQAIATPITATPITAPPFTTRDLHIYATASIDEAHSATLHYRIGQAPEQHVEKHEFPWEFTIHTEDLTAPISWQLDLELADGREVSMTTSIRL